MHLGHQPTIEALPQVLAAMGSGLGVVGREFLDRVLPLLLARGGY